MQALAYKSGWHEMFEQCGVTFKKYERTNLTKICGEETIDEWVGRGVEGGEGLDEGGHRGGGGDKVVHLQQNQVEQCTP